MATHRAVRRSLFAPLLAALLAGCLDDSLIRQPELSVTPGAPIGWHATSTTAGIGLTNTDTHTGSGAAYLSSAFQSGFGSFTLVQYVRADSYRGKRMRLSAWVKPRNVANVSVSGIWMRVDAPTTVLAYDDMSRRIVAGLGGWRRVSVVLDVGPTALGIAFGAMFQGSNTLLVDDFTFEEVGTDVSSTSMISAPQSSGLDSVATALVYERSTSIPANLDFEGLAPVGAETTEWIRQHAVALASTTPTASVDDLGPLQDMVGSAHLVALGDATYGMRESMQLRHRLLHFLVTRMGFTTVALEAPPAEADDINHYVMTGSGDPARLLSRLYSWGWNTREVADMIAWIREWNATAPPAQRVQVRGVDPLYPGASMDSVIAFIGRAEPAIVPDVTSRYACLNAFRNRGATAGRPRSEYAILPIESRRQCADEIADATLLVSLNGADTPGFEAALQHARLVQQFEAVAAVSNAAASNRRRDSSMAENVAWLREQAGPAARLVIMSHNDRITRLSGTMGAALTARYGNDYRSMALAFGTGQFNAGIQQGGSIGAVQSFPVQHVPAQTVEEAFLSATTPLLLLDMRRTVDGGSAAFPLRGPIGLRTVGLGFDPSVESMYFARRLFPDDFDLLLFARTGTASTLLPFVN